ncbi:four-carbon acid sugar kinase family protein [Gibbsiella greigii]
MQWNTPVLVIADDFTGANDAGIGLASAGAQVRVLFEPQAAAAQTQGVRVISTDSRAATAEEAAQRVRQALAGWPQGLGWVFKKIDSTLRGNLGAEAEAALLASGAPMALIAPAVPRLGRITRGGNCLIHGSLLTETEFASDPKTPITTASIQQRLKQQSALPCSHLPLAAVRGGELQAALAQLQQQHARFVIVDAETDDDLQRLMLAAARLPQRPLLIGATGLSDALGRLLADRRPAPLLAVIGSMSEMAQRQIAELNASHAITLVDIDIEAMFQGWPQLAYWRSAVLQALAQGRHCVIRTSRQAAQRQTVDQLCRQHRITRRRLGEDLCTLLAQLTQEVLEIQTPAGLYLSGGDVALAVARGLGANGFQIHGQVAGCVPWGHLLNARHNLLVMTKAGGFGDENTLVEVIRFIEEKSSE